jgi:hypothetical protein
MEKGPLWISGSYRGPQPLAVSVVQCSDWGPGSVRVRQLNTTLPTVPKQDGTG